MILVNLYGGPGSGKSTMAASIFSELKWKGINCELVTEYAKDKVWEGSLNILDNQLYVLAKQYHKLFRLKNKVEVIITDSPLLFSLFYGESMSNNFKNLVFDLYQEFHNIDIFLNRQKPYNPSGRLQTEDVAKSIDISIKQILKNKGISYFSIDGEKSEVKTIVQIIEFARKRQL